MSSGLRQNTTRWISTRFSRSNVKSQGQTIEIDVFDVWSDISPVAEAPCCSKVYMCRLCHDEAENHTLDRFKVTEIKCLECNTIQKVGRSCSKCNIVFGAYYCAICRLFDNIDKKQFHCPPCGICRVGGRENYFHCPRCDMCYGMALKNAHKCIDKVARADCPICLEDLHSSVKKVHVPKCSHLMHMDCYESCLQTGNYACPLCGQSLQNMNDVWRQTDREIAETPMPAEYRKTKVHVLCKDCHGVTETPFHVLGLKCQDCGSYNTCNTDAPDPARQQGAGRPEGGDTQMEANP